MPRYKKKITRPLEFAEFRDAIQEETKQRQAFLSILFFSGCRISEALALTSENISCTSETIYIEFHRLKGSKQTDPIPLPKITLLEWICSTEGKLFTFSRRTGYRIVKRWFPDLYPHYFRMNRITDISIKHGDAHVYSFTGICAQSIDHYRAKVDIKRVAESLKKETER